MAHKKGVGSTDNGRDSKSKRLGVKLFGGQIAKAGNIIVRQRGTKYHPGENVGMGKDFTLHALIDGTVAFKKKRKNRTFVSILPFVEVEERVAKPEQIKAKSPAKPKTPAKGASPASSAKATPKKESTPPKKAKAAKDDLKKVEGIGPKIEELLHNSGILTFADLAETDVEKVKAILSEAGSRFSRHDPTTWPRQAKFAAEGQWEELKKWQDELDGGKIVVDSSEEE